MENESVVNDGNAVERSTDYLRVQAGKSYIGINWECLSKHTKYWLVLSGQYDKSGCPTKPVRPNDLDEIAALEYFIGILKLCVQAEMPGKVLKPLTAEASAHEKLCDQVLTAAGKMMTATPTPEPMFLRLALEAIQHHQVAILKLYYPDLPDSKNQVSILWSRFGFVMLIFSPALIAFAMVSAVRGDLIETVLALYGVALSIFVWFGARTLNSEDAKVIDSYRGWLNLSKMRVGPWLQDGPWHLGGVGLHSRLEKMVQDGVEVPPIALDLCSTLAACVIERFAKEPS